MRLFETAVDTGSISFIYLFIDYYSKGVLFTHDAVAQKDYYPHLPEIPLEVDEDEETIKIVQLVKSNEPLVCTL